MDLLVSTRFPASTLTQRVETTQRVQHRAMNADRRQVLEVRLTSGVEALSSLKQTDGPLTDQVVELDGVARSPTHLPRDAEDKRGVLLDQLFAVQRRRLDPCPSRLWIGTGVGSVGSCYPCGFSLTLWALSSAAPSST